MLSDAFLRSTRTLLAIIGGAAISLSLCGLPAAVFACDTPVYRYAMYRWEATPYEVYHFHRGEIGAAFAAVQAEIANVNSDKVSPANVAVYPVNLGEDPELKSVPRDVRKLWETKHESGIEAPLTLIVNPKGYEVFSGELRNKEIAALVKSPARTEIGKHLQQGHAGVYILVPGKDGEQNKAAEEAVAKLVKDVNAGKLQLYTGPQPYNPLDPKFELPKGESSPDDVDDDTTPRDDAVVPKDQPPHSVVTMKLSRDDIEAKDPWLYRSLMAVESDLHEFQGEPMLFVVYGRGRVLPPYIGKGIVYSNLVEITDFITGACSCTVKDQNPGVDLLMAYDWESASAALVEKFGSEEGNNESLTDLFPQLIVPGGDAKEVVNPAGDAGDGNTEVAADDVDIAPNDGNASDDGQTSTTGSDAQPKSSTDDTASAKNVESADEAAGPDRIQNSKAADNSGDIHKNSTKDIVASASAIDDPDVQAVGGPNLIVTLGIGMGVAFLALLAATFLILKPQ